MAWAGVRRLADSTNASTTKSQAALEAARPQAVGMLERSMLGRQSRRRAIRPQFRSHAAFAAHAPSDMDNLVWPQLGEAEAPERLHMNEDVRGAFATCQKPKSADPVEPLHPGPLPVTFRCDLHVRALRQLGGVDGRA